MERYIAIDNVCAWPNLTLMPNGDIVAVIFNQPCHGTRAGDVEAWASADGGRTWHLRGVVAPHEPQTVRMNVAAGLAHDGDLVTLVSGWSDIVPEDGEVIGDAPFRKGILEPWVCRSDDGGRTWTHTETLATPEDVYAVIPFGDIVQGEGDTLVASFYSRKTKKQYRPNSYVTVSGDDGRTWPEHSVIADGRFNETALLRTGGGRWLAAARTTGPADIELYCADEAGGNWSGRGPVTFPGQHPGHLLQLADRRILLTFGMRNTGMYGVGARVSDDDGESWSGPVFLADLNGASDGGYPASVQTEDGTVVTAYYGNRTTGHHRYHAGVVRWDIDEMF